jgi:hypothetical protein
MQKEKINQCWSLDEAEEGASFLFVLVRALSKLVFSHFTSDMEDGISSRIERNGIIDTRSTLVNLRRIVPVHIILSLQTRLRNKHSISGKKTPLENRLFGQKRLLSTRERQRRKDQENTRKCWDTSPEEALWQPVAQLKLPSQMPRFQ